MQQILKGPIHKLYITKKVQNKKLNFVIEDEILMEEALFYQNIFGVILSYPDKHPMTTIGDAYWYVKHCAQKNPELIHDIWCPYIDYDELEPIKLSKEERKKIKTFKK